MEFDSVDASQPDESSSSMSFTSRTGSSHFDRRIMVRRQGDTICCINKRNMSKELPKEDTVISDQQDDDMLISVPESVEEHVQSEQEEVFIKEVDLTSHSGSSFKTFTFGDQDNTLESKKCIAFWKLVMENNLQPIKTCLITKDLNKTESSVDDKVAIEEIKETCKDEANDEYKILWKNIIQEIQNAKLDKIKANIKARCQICQSEVNLIKTPIEKNKLKPPIKESHSSRIEKPKKSCLTKTSKSDERRYSNSQNEVRSSKPIKFKRRIGSDLEVQSIAPSPSPQSFTSNSEMVLSKGDDNLESDVCKPKFQMRRQVSLLLPSGEVTLLERQSVSCLDWDVPVKSKTDTSSIKSSVELLIDKKIKEGTLSSSFTTSQSLEKCSLSKKSSSRLEE